MPNAAPPPRAAARLMVALAIVLAAIGAAAAIAGHPAPGVVFVALSAAISGTGLRHYLRKDPRA